MVTRIYIYIMYIKNTRGESFPERVPGANATPLRRHHARVYIYPPRRSMCAPHTHAHKHTSTYTKGNPPSPPLQHGWAQWPLRCSTPHSLRALYNMTIPPPPIARARGKNRQDPFRVGYIHYIYTTQYVRVAKTFSSYNTCINYTCECVYDVRVFACVCGGSVGYVGGW